MSGGQLDLSAFSNEPAANTSKDYLPLVTQSISVVRTSWHCSYLIALVLDIIAVFTMGIDAVLSVHVGIRFTNSDGGAHSNASQLCFSCVRSDCDWCSNPGHLGGKCSKNRHDENRLSNAMFRLRYSNLRLTRIGSLERYGEKNYTPELG